MPITIITNNVPRSIIYGYELPESARTAFDYLDEDEFEHHDFVQYKGNYYDLSELMRLDHIEDTFKGWDGYHGNSYFSGVLIKLVDDERVIMGRYYS